MIFTFVGYQEHFPRNACLEHYSGMRLQVQTEIVIINIKCVRYNKRCNATTNNNKHIPFFEVLSLLFWACLPSCIAFKIEEKVIKN